MFCKMNVNINKKLSELQKNNPTKSETLHGKPKVGRWGYCSKGTRLVGK